MSDGRETPVFDLGVRAIHVTRIEGSGPLAYRIEQNKAKVTLTADELVRIAAVVQADIQLAAQKR